jgi:Zn ribbon nucleic-acid-binding protein
MGAYNELIAEVKCPRCNSKSDISIQYKYADTWQYTYKIGDLIRWGGNDHGEGTVDHALALGLADCPKCDAELELEISIERDVIISANVLEKADKFIGKMYIYV